jgi:hypothetical protein
LRYRSLKTLASLGGALSTGVHVLLARGTARFDRRDKRDLSNVSVLYRTLRSAKCAPRGAAERRLLAVEFVREASFDASDLFAQGQAAREQCKRQLADLHAAHGIIGR